MWDYGAPTFVLSMTVVLTMSADRAARTRRAPSGECGDFWGRLLLRFSVVGGLLLLVSIALELPQLESIRYTLFFERGADSRAYALAHLAPVGVWMAMVLWGIAERPRTRNERIRWIAGSAGQTPSRLWVLLLCLVPGVVVLGALLLLGVGSPTYPAAAWMSLALLALGFAGVAFSAGRDADPEAEAQRVPAEEEREPAPWPESLRSAGLEVELLAELAPDARAVSQERPDPLGVAAWLAAQGATSVAPELIEAVSHVIDPTHSSSSPPKRIVFAPDDCGQVEVTAFAAEFTRRHAHALTLLIAAGDAGRLAARMNDALPPGFATAPGTDKIPFDASVIVVDAQTLSDSLLQQLKDPATAQRFGLVVWWHLESFTGVLGANLWAISRRLHRLLRARGLHDVRTLAFAQSSDHPEAQLSEFIQRLLPERFTPEERVYVPSRVRRHVSVYRVDARSDRAHPAVVATRASIAAGWTTHLERPGRVSADELEELDQEDTGGKLSERRLSSAARADARILEVEPSSILSLREMLVESGRCEPGDRPFYVGLVPPENPYARYLLREHRDLDPPAARRLVCAEAQPRILRRHLVAALNELPDTVAGLLGSFRFEAQVIHKTLDEIREAGQARRTEVPYLDHREQRLPDLLYTSQAFEEGARRPLDSVGTDLAQVRDPTGDEASGVVMRLDPERLAICAYPQRVFLAGGRRYRIRDAPPTEIQGVQTVRCQAEDRPLVTWRQRNAEVHEPRPASAELEIDHARPLRGVVKLDLIYSERVSGVLQAGAYAARAPDEAQSLTLQAAVPTSFATRGLALRLAGRLEMVPLASLAQALRDALPVHLGVGPDALEVVPMQQVRGAVRPVDSLVIVDLYPGGVGIADAIYDDTQFLLDVLRGARRWLERCPCQADDGCTECLLTPAARAASPHYRPRRSEALGLLARVG